MRSQKTRALVAGGISVLVAGMVASAAIPGGGGVITACYNTMKKSFRVIDYDAGARCGSGETMLTWNQTGPAGPPGIQGLPGNDGVDGADGVDGVDGAPGPSDLYFAEQPDGIQLHGGGVQTTIATLTLPAGNYLLSSSFAILNTAGHWRSAHCLYEETNLGRPDPSPVGQPMFIGAPPENALGGQGPDLFIGYSNASMQAALTLSVTSLVKLRCARTGWAGESVSAQFVSMNAIKVGATHAAP